MIKDETYIYIYNLLRSVFFAAVVLVRYATIHSVLQ